MRNLKQLFWGNTISWINQNEYVWTLQKFSVSLMIFSNIKAHNFGCSHKYLYSCMHHKSPLNTTLHSTCPPMLHEFPGSSIWLAGYCHSCPINLQDPLNNSLKHQDCPLFLEYWTEDILSLCFSHSAKEWNISKWGWDIAHFISKCFTHWPFSIYAVI